MVMWSADQGIWGRARMSVYGECPSEGPEVRTHRGGGGYDLGTVLLTIHKEEKRGTPAELGKTAKGGGKTYRVQGSEKGASMKLEDLIRSDVENTEGKSGSLWPSGGRRLAGGGAES